MRVQGLRALPATAQVRPPADEFTHRHVGRRRACHPGEGIACCAVQVAKQQGQYLAKLVSAGLAPGKVPEGIAPFKYNHKGSLAYVGAHLFACTAAAAAARSSLCAADHGDTHVRCDVQVFYLYSTLSGTGRDRAVMDVPGIGPISGLFAGIAWKARYFLFTVSVVFAAA